MADHARTITIGIDPSPSGSALAVHWYGIMYVVAFATAYYLGPSHAISRASARTTWSGWPLDHPFRPDRRPALLRRQNLDLMHSVVDVIACGTGGWPSTARSSGSRHPGRPGWRWKLPIWVSWMPAPSSPWWASQSAGSAHHQRRHPGRAEQPPVGDAYTTLTLSSRPGTGSASANQPPRVRGAGTCHPPHPARSAPARCAAGGGHPQLRGLYSVSQFLLDFLRRPSRSSLRPQGAAANGHRGLSGMPLLVILWRRTKGARARSGAAADGTPPVRSRSPRRRPRLRHGSGADHHGLRREPQRDPARPYTRARAGERHPSGSRTVLRFLTFVVLIRVLALVLRANPSHPLCG